VGNQATMVGAAFGRGMAAIIKTTFGFMWLGWGLGALVGLPAAIWFGYLCVAAVLLAFSVTAVRRGRKMMIAHGASRSDFWQTRRKPFGIVTVLELVGCIIVVVLANVFRRQDLIAIGISLIVGLHFLPLGKIFGAASYYWVGSLIVIWDIVTITALKSWNSTASAAIPTGVILWVSAVCVLTPFSPYRELMADSQRGRGDASGQTPG
jgi:uncharacterized membrane protein YecN with MAPEG domain